MDRWVILGLLALLGLLLALGLWLWVFRGSASAYSAELPLPGSPQTLCERAQQLLAQYRYEIASANCGALGGAIRAAITFIPDKSGSFIPDKSGTLRNVLSLSFQDLEGMGTLLRVHIQALRRSAQGRWLPDPKGPLYLSAQELLRRLAEQLKL